MSRAKSVLRLAALLGLLVNWFLPAQLASANVVFASSAESECAHEDDPQACLAELRVESNAEDESDDESSDSEDDNSDDESDDGSDDNSDDGSDDGSSSNSGNGNGSSNSNNNSGKGKDKDHSIPARVIKPHSTETPEDKATTSSSGKKPGKKPPPAVTNEVLASVITTEITTERAALLRTAVSTSSSTAASAGDYLPRVGSIGAHDARRAGSGSLIAATLASQSEKIHKLTEGLAPVAVDGDGDADSVVEAIEHADFSDPAEEFMAKTTFAAAVVGAGAVALVANAIKNRRRIKLENADDYDYGSSK